MRCSLQDIVVESFAGYAAARKLHPRELRAAACISRCYTPALGAHVLRCPAGHFERLQPHACRHRACPRCAEPARSRWIDAQMLRLLPCGHFHTVFTVPHDLLALWSYNREQLTSLLFASARDSLMELMADPRRLGVLPGLLLSLHTWGRNLSYHPHLHCLVSAGGLDANGRWKSSRGHVSVSALPLKKLFRGKFLGGLGELLKLGRLKLPAEQDCSYWRQVVRQLYRTAFNVEVCDTYPHGRGVALYLARYVKGGPLPKDRALRCDGRSVAFEYHDHRLDRTQSIRMPVPEFIRRILWHAPPRGQHLTRHAGLYSSARIQQHQAAQAELSGLQSSSPWPRPQHGPSTAPIPLPTEPPRCPHCRLTLQRRPVPQVHQRGEISLQTPAARTQATAQSPRPPPQRGSTGRSN